MKGVCTLWMENWKGRGQQAWWLGCHSAALPANRKNMSTETSWSSTTTTTKKQMWSLVPGTEKPHKSVELRGSSIKKFSKKGPVTPDRHEVKHGSAVHFCRNQGQLLSCTSQNCYFPLFSMFRTTPLQSNVSCLFSPVLDKYLQARASPVQGHQDSFGTKLAKVGGRIQNVANNIAIL